MAGPQVSISVNVVVAMERYAKGRIAEHSATDNTLCLNDARSPVLFFPLALLFWFAFLLHPFPGLSLTLDKFLP